MTPKLTKRDVAAIKRWLSLDKFEKDHGCPWRLTWGKGNRFICKRTCCTMFSRVKWLDDVQDRDKCPCTTYSHAHVIRTARKMIYESTR